MPEDTLAARARLDAAVQDLTVPRVFQRAVASNPDVVALKWKHAEAWQQVTWHEYGERVRHVALGLRDLFGLQRHDTVNLMTRNVAPFFWCDMAAAHLGCTSVSVYNTLSPDQIAYIVGHSGARIAIVENRDFLERFLKVRGELPRLEKIVLVDEDDDVAGTDDVILLSEVEEAGRRADGDEFAALWQEVAPGDLCTLIYTSGTTGPPKGVMITHRNVCWTAACFGEMLEREPGMEMVSYLPMAHIAERLSSLYLGAWHAQTVTCCPDPNLIVQYLAEVRPHTFFAVPRVWEKAYAGLQAAMAAEQDETRKQFLGAALDAGRQWVAYEQKGENPPEELKAQFENLNAMVLSQVRARIGLDRYEVAISGAAPLAPEIIEFFHTVGIRIAEIYGLSETTGPATWNPPTGRIKIGSVGPAMPGIEVKLADDGEVMIAGGNIFAGYYNDVEKTAEALTADGWLLTGDIGEFDEDGYLRIVDRKKELIITAGGKNISPANLENLLKTKPLIGQAAVIGDQRPFLSAVIVLEAEAATAWAAQHGISASSPEELAEHPEVQAEIQRAVDDVNAQVSRVEGIKKFVVIGTEWGPDSDELTPTLKLKRRVINEKYADLIDSMYAR